MTGIFHFSSILFPFPTKTPLNPGVLMILLQLNDILILPNEAQYYIRGVHGQNR